MTEFVRLSVDLFMTTAFAAFTLGVIGVTLLGAVKFYAEIKQALKE